MLIHMSTVRDNSDLGQWLHVRRGDADCSARGRRQGRATACHDDILVHPHELAGRAHLPARSCGGRRKGRFEYRIDIQDIPMRAKQAFRIAVKIE